MTDKISFPATVSHKGQCPKSGRNIYEVEFSKSIICRFKHLRTSNKLSAKVSIPISDNYEKLDKWWNDTDAIINEWETLPDKFIFGTNYKTIYKKPPSQIIGQVKSAIQNSKTHQLNEDKWEHNEWCPGWPVLIHFKKGNDLDIPYTDNETLNFDMINYLNIAVMRILCPCGVGLKTGVYDIDIKLDQPIDNYHLTEPGKILEKTSIYTFNGNGKDIDHVYITPSIENQHFVINIGSLLHQFKTKTLESCEFPIAFPGKTLSLYEFTITSLDVFNLKYCETSNIKLPQISRNFCGIIMEGEIVGQLSLIQGGKNIYSERYIRNIKSYREPSPKKLEDIFREYVFPWFKEENAILGSDYS